MRPTCTRAHTVYLLQTSKSANIRNKLFKSVLSTASPFLNNGRILKCLHDFLDFIYIVQLIKIKENQKNCMVSLAIICGYSVILI